METGDRPFELHGTLWLSVAGEKLGGGQRMALLAGIAECGSISQAARAMQMSYKAAWDAIDSMNNLAGEPLVARVAGGRSGGLGHARRSRGQPDWCQSRHHQCHDGQRRLHQLGGASVHHLCEQQG